MAMLAQNDFMASSPRYVCGRGMLDFFNWECSSLHIRFRCGCKFDCHCCGLARSLLQSHPVGVHCARSTYVTSFGFSIRQMGCSGPEGCVPCLSGWGSGDCSAQRLTEVVLQLR